MHRSEYDFDVCSGPASPPRQPQPAQPVPREPASLDPAAAPADRLAPT